LEEHGEKMKNKQNAQDKENQLEETSPSRFSPVPEIRSLESLGKKYFEEREYAKAHDAYSGAAIKARNSGFMRVYANYMILAGNAAYEQGGWLNYQRAADCYASVGERGLLEKMLKELKYREEDISGGSWMGMARDMAKINESRYPRW
jgi:hypothetical protein